MKKGKKSEKLKGFPPSSSVGGKKQTTDNCYENYVAIKQKESQEEEMMEKEPKLDTWRTSLPDYGQEDNYGDLVEKPYTLTRQADGPPGIKAFRLPTKKPKGYQYIQQYNYGTIGAYMEPTVRTEMEESQLLPELEASEAKLPSDIEMFEEVRNNLRIIRAPERTLIYGIVVDKKNEQNVVAALRCFGGVAFGGYAHDVSGDAYLVECVQSVHLGTVPFSYRIEMPKAGIWSVDIPIPEKVLETAFAPPQRKTLSDLKDKFPADRYEIHFLQMLMAN